MVFFMVCEIIQLTSDCKCHYCSRLSMSSDCMRHHNFVKPFRERFAVLIFVEIMDVPVCSSPNLGFRMTAHI